MTQVYPYEPNNLSKKIKVRKQEPVIRGIWNTGTYIKAEHGEISTKGKRLAKLAESASFKKYQK
jgi:hypothetical protein